MHESTEGDVASLNNRPILTFPVVPKIAKSQYIFGKTVDTILESCDSSIDDDEEQKLDNFNQ